MKKILLINFLLIVGVVSCKKDEVDITPPNVSFKFNNSDLSNYTIGVYDNIFSENTSEDADSYLWDFGNGTTSTKKDVNVEYQAPGTYTLKLTAFKGNKSSSISKQIQVVGPVLKQISVTRLNWNTTVGKLSSIPTFTKANLFVEILRGENGQTYTTTSGTFNAPLVFKTNIAQNVDPSNIPLNFNVPGRFVLDVPTLNSDKGDYKGIGYIINLYAQDSNGSYLLVSNIWSGVNFLYNGDYTTKKFIVSVHAFQNYSIELHGNYE